MNFPGIEFLETEPKFKRREVCSLRYVYALHKTSFEGISRRTRAVTAKKCTKKVCCTCKVVFLLITPIVVVFFLDVLLAVVEVFAKAPYCACVKGLETLPYSPVKQFDDVIISLKSF